MDRLVNDQPSRAGDHANGDDAVTVYRDLRRRNERRASLARLLEVRRQRRIQTVEYVLPKRRLHPRA